MLEIGPEDAVSSGAGEEAVTGEGEAVVVPVVWRRIEFLPCLAPIGA